jgi:hypothetical protein
MASRSSERAQGRVRMALLTGASRTVFLSQHSLAIGLAAIPLRHGPP